MRLFVEDPEENKKIYIGIHAQDKKALAEVIGSRRFKINNKTFYVTQVKAEKSSDNTAAGILLGGFLGLVGGPFGVAAGGLLGGIMGRDQDDKDTREVEAFNRSRLK